MKLVGIEDNIVDIDNKSSEFLIVSDQPIKKYSYYFELEARRIFELNGAAIAFIEKDQNNEFVKDNNKREHGSYTELERTQYHEFHHKYTTTTQYFQNSLNLELGSRYPAYYCELSIMDDKNNFNYAKTSYQSYYYKSYSGNQINYHRLGLGIDIDLDNKITTLNYYSDQNGTNVKLISRISINKIFDPDRLYIVIYPQYLTIHHYRDNEYNSSIPIINTTSKQINYAKYKFFFDKDEIKYTDLYKKYNHPATVVEKLGGGGVWNERQ